MESTKSEINIEDFFSAFNTSTPTMDEMGCMRCGSDNFIKTTEGCLVCSECGTESHSNIISEQAEWNMFNADTNERCEYNNSELLHNDNMSTQISFKKNMSHSNWKLIKLQRTFQLDSKDRSLIKVYNKIEQHCTQYDIKQVVVDTTKHLYKFISTKKLSRGAVREAMLASCLYYAFIHNNNPRNIEEVSNIFQANIKKVNKTNKMLSQYLWHSDTYKHLVLQTTNTEQIIYRYCNKIDINQIHTSQILTLAHSYENDHNMIGKDCSYIAALAIYNYCIKNNLHITKDSICEACFLSTVTLNKLLKKDF